MYDRLNKQLFEAEGLGLDALQIGISADKLAADKDLGDGADAALAGGQILLDESAVGHLVELDHLERGPVLPKCGLGGATVRAVGL